MGERQLDKLEVVGSIPTSPTTSPMSLMHCRGGDPEFGTARCAARLLLLALQLPVREDDEDDDCRCASARYESPHSSRACGCCDRYRRRDYHRNCCTGQKLLLSRVGAHVEVLERGRASSLDYL